MSAILAVDVDQGAPLGISVAGQSPHAFAYRFWHRIPGADQWTQFAEGQTGDAVPDAVTLGPLPAGTIVSWSIAVAGRPNTHYRVLITLAQNNAPVPGGAVTHEGGTSASGGALVQHQLVLA